jgi:enolase
MLAIEAAGLVPGEDIGISLDVAASEFGRNGRYRLGLERRELDRDGLAEYLLEWCDRYPILAIEDPFAEDDAEGFTRFTAAVGHRIQVIGDDYLVTNASLVQAAATAKTVNAVLIKVNQAGTVSEAYDACEVARHAGFGTIVSARSGETEDVAIVHLAIGWCAGQLKVGSFARSERMAKWNEAIRIEEASDAKARFAGSSVLPIGRLSKGRLGSQAQESMESVGSASASRANATTASHDAACAAPAAPHENGMMSIRR